MLGKFLECEADKNNKYFKVMTACAINDSKEKCMRECELKV